jgi:hypothetical protein
MNDQNTITTTENISIHLLCTYFVTKPILEYEDVVENRTEKHFYPKTACILIEG